MMVLGNINQNSARQKIVPHRGDRITLAGSHRNLLDIDRVGYIIHKYVSCECN